MINKTDGQVGRCPDANLRRMEVAVGVDRAQQQSKENDQHGNHEDAQADWKIPLDVF